jgi:hypothetical protein
MPTFHTSHGTIFSIVARNVSRLIGLLYGSNPSR